MKRAWCNPEQSFSKLDKKKIRCRRRRRRISRFSDWWCTLLEFTHRIHQSVVDLQFIKCRAWNCGNKKTRYSSITWYNVTFWAEKTITPNIDILNRLSVLLSLFFVRTTFWRMYQNNVPLVSLLFSSSSTELYYFEYIFV